MFFFDTYNFFNSYLAGEVLGSESTGKLRMDSAVLHLKFTKLY